MTAKRQNSQKLENLTRSHGGTEFSASLREHTRYARMRGEAFAQGRRACFSA